MFIKEVQVKELTISEMLHIAKKVYFDNFRTLLFIIIIIFFPINIISSILEANIAKIYSAVNFDAILQNPELFEKFILSGENKQVALYNFIFMMIQIFFIPLGVMAVAKVTNDFIYGGKTQYKHAILDSFSKGASLVITILLYGIIVFLGIGVITMIFFGNVLFGKGILFSSTYLMGIFVLFIFYLILFCYFYFYVYAVALSEKKGFSALKHSVKLVKGRWFKTLGIILLFGFVNNFVSIGLQRLLSLDSNIFFLVVFSKTAAACVDIFFYTIVGVWFLNREFITLQQQQKSVREE